LRRADYVLGKAGAIAVLLSLTTWVPGLFLVLLKTSLRADVRWLAGQSWLPASIAGYSIVLIATCTLLTLALSSLSASPRLASAQLFAFVALSGVVAQLLAALTHAAGWQLLSFNIDLDQVASWFFREVPRYDVPAWTALLVLVLFGIAGALLLRTRVRAVDVVGGS
jgi:hypothetical protein